MYSSEWGDDEVILDCFQGEKMLDGFRVRKCWMVSG